MKFPGKRKSKHYFPVNARDPLLQPAQTENEVSTSYIVGIDQTLVDIEAKVDEGFIARYGLSQDFARPLRAEGAWGLLYNSVRLSGHECVAAFRPPALSLPVQGQHFRYVWDGKAQAIAWVLQLSEVPR